MSDSLLDQQIVAATAYEELHVPALFHQWPNLLLDAIPIEPGHAVLDVACGTGVLAREAAVRVGPKGKVSGVDPGPGMLAVARKLAPEVHWHQGVAEALPFEDESFNAVVSQFGMMFFSDRVKAVKEMLRVLRSGSHLAVAVWDSLENSPAYPIEVALLQRMAGDDAANALRAPFVLGEQATLVELFERVGVDSIAVKTCVGTARFPSVRVMVEADLRGWLPVMGVDLGEEQIQQILSEAETALSRYVVEDGSVVFDAPAHIITGRKP